MSAPSSSTDCHVGGNGNDDVGVDASTEALSIVPKSIIDAHHHYVDSSLPFSTFLSSIAGPDLKYTPEQYLVDVRDDLTRAGIDLAGSVHVEAMPDDGSSEASWVDQLEAEGRSVTVKAIVGSVDLAKGAESAGSDMDSLISSSPTAGRVRGVRWIVDCVGPFGNGSTKTHVATKRHDGVDYLRGSDGGYQGTTVPSFESGYAELAPRNLSFDLQCAPEQLPAAMDLARRHPGVPVVIDHLGKPRKVLGEPKNDGDDADACSSGNVAALPGPDEMRIWRAGLDSASSLPHVYIKISMLGYAVPGWCGGVDGGNNAARERVVRDLVLETVARFGPKRCMFATNWWANAALSDSDGFANVGPSPSTLVTKLATWLAEAGYGEEERDWIFRRTAEKFYRIDLQSA